MNQTDWYCEQYVVKLLSNSEHMVHEFCYWKVELSSPKEKIYIYEYWTKTQKKLVFACRKLKKDSQSSITKTCIYNGNVFNQDSDENKVCVMSLEDLDPYKPQDENNDQ